MTANNWDELRKEIVRMREENKVLKLALENAVVSVPCKDCGAVDDCSGINNGETICSDVFLINARKELDHE